MTTLRKKIILTLLSAGLMASMPAVASADNCCDPCDWDPCACMEFEVGVDFLWWKPCDDDLVYAAERTKTNPDTYKYKNVCPDWEPGVRIYLGLPEFYCDLNLKGSYTYIESNDSSSIGESSTSVSHAIAHPGTDISDKGDSGKGKWDATYHEWDILLSFDISCKDCHQFSPYFGVAGIKFDQELKAEIIDDNKPEVTKWSSDYWGVGLRLGSEYQYRLSDCMLFFVKGDGSILVGEADSKITFDDERDSDSDADFIFHDNEDCHFLPGYHIGTGIIYDSCICNWDFSFKLGYEFLMWHNVPKHPQFPENVTRSEARSQIPS